MSKQKPDFQRVAFSPGEFARLFGKEQTWGYRQLYSGKVKAITDNGRLMIPASEVERILGTAGIYDGERKKLPNTKPAIQKLSPKFKHAWRQYVLNFREGRGGRLQKSSVKNVARGKVPWGDTKNLGTIRRPWGRKKS